MSEMVIEPDLVPTTVGVKVTLIEQDEPPARLAPQLLVWEKSPEATMLEMVKATLPVLRKVATCAALAVPRSWLLKVKLPTGRNATGVALPTPDKVIVCGLVTALSVIVIEPKRLPEKTGVNVTLIVQLPPAATLVGQLVICVKSPVEVTLEMLSGALPVLDKVTVCAALVVPMAWPANVSVVVDRLTTGTAWPTPVSCTVCVLPETLPVLSVMVRVPVRIPAIVGTKITLIEQLTLGERIEPHVLA